MKREAYLVLKAKNSGKEGERKQGEKEYRILHWRTFGIESECPILQRRTFGVEVKVVRNMTPPTGGGANRGGVGGEGDFGFVI